MVASKPVGEGAAAVGDGCGWGDRMKGSVIHAASLKRERVTERDGAVMWV